MKNILSLLVLCAGVWTAAGSSVDFNHFWTVEEISAYLLLLDRDFSDYAHIERYGTTAEGRFLEGIHIDTDHNHKSRSSDKVVVVIEAGMRPREWMSVMTAVYFIHEIVEHAYEFENILDHVEFVVIPVANPDGYAFSHSVGNRQWNKNRRNNANNAACRGVDVNANFGFAFLARPGDECSDTYPGAASFSEAESLNLRNLLLLGKYSGRISAYISLQAHGTQIAVPLSSQNSGSGNTAATLNLANRVAARINQQNLSRNYQVGIGGGIRQPERGTVTDYAVTSLAIPYVLTIFLPAGGSTGFDPPTTQIMPIAGETFYGLLEVAEYLI